MVFTYCENTAKYEELVIYKETNLQGICKRTNPIQSASGGYSQ